MDDNEATNRLYLNRENAWLGFRQARRAVARGA
jgi:hypothetical protein